MTTRTAHTHTGTCQACGRQQAVDNKTRLVAKHGYKVSGFHYFVGVCRGANLEPAELCIDMTKQTIAWCNTTAATHDESINALKSGNEVPTFFERWNKSKIKVNKGHYGQTYETKGDYDTLPIASATERERLDAINGAIREHSNNAASLRMHSKFLTESVLTRFGQPLTLSFEQTRIQFEIGMVLSTASGKRLKLLKPWYSFAGKHKGWRGVLVDAGTGKELPYTTRELNTMKVCP